MAPGDYAGMGSACRAALDTYVDATVANVDIANGGRSDAERVLDNGNYLAGCGVPPSMTIIICAAVLGRGAQGVSVTTIPDDRLRGGCVAEAARRLRFSDTGQRLDLALTVFAADDRSDPGPALTQTGFDRASALASLAEAGASAAKCGSPKGEGRVAITFSAATGKATNVEFEGFMGVNGKYADFRQTAASRCVEAIFRKVQVPPFTGDDVTVHKTYSVP